MFWNWNIKYTLNDLELKDLIFLLLYEVRFNCRLSATHPWLWWMLLPCKALDGCDSMLFVKSNLCQDKPPWNAGWRVSVDVKRLDYLLMSQLCVCRCNMLGFDIEPQRSITGTCLLSLNDLQYQCIFIYIANFSI